MEATAAPQRSWLARWSPLGGLIYVIGIVIVVLTPAGDETGDTAAEVVSQAEANENWYGALALFGLLGLLLLGWFVAGLALRLRDAGARDESVVAFAGGLMFTVLSFVALMVFTAPLFGSPRATSRKTKSSRSRRPTSTSTTSAGSPSGEPESVPD